MKKFELTEKQIKWLNECTRFSKEKTWSMRYDGKIDVFSDFNCSGQGLTDFLGIEFGTIEGSFYCSNNKLKNLEGAPESTYYEFHCNDNELESLKGITKNTGTYSSSGTGGGIYCQNNKLTSLKGLPRRIYGDLNCSNNLLETLLGAPKRVNCDFDCSNNKLITLIGGPEIVGGNIERTEEFEESDWSYDCSGNPISDVELFESYREYRKDLKEAKKLVEKACIEKATK